MLEQGTQAPSPAPDLIPAESQINPEDSHSDWYSERGHFIRLGAKCSNSCKRGAQYDTFGNDAARVAEWHTRGT